LTLDPAVLAVDVGGSHVKLLASGVAPDEKRQFKSGKRLTAERMVERVVEAAQDWEYEVVSVGIPAQVHAGKVVHEPVNLGRGWTCFDYEAAFGKPTKVINDAAMQAIGSYEGGRMLFLGFGTGLGSAMVVDGIVEPFELGHLPFKDKTYEEYVNDAARDRLGKKRWNTMVREVVEAFYRALEPDYVVIGGGAEDHLDALPDYCRPGDNANAFLGGFRLWHPDAGRE
jgi:predicted NBD/HSP70 family sugar kinase